MIPIQSTLLKEGTYSTGKIQAGKFKVISLRIIKQFHRLNSSTPEWEVQSLRIDAAEYVESEAN